MPGLPPAISLLRQADATCYPEYEGINFDLCPTRSSEIYWLQVTLVAKETDRRLANYQKELYTLQVSFLYWSRCLGPKVVNVVLLMIYTVECGLRAFVERSSYPWNRHDVDYMESSLPDYFFFKFAFFLFRCLFQELYDWCPGGIRLTYWLFRWAGLASSWQPLCNSRDCNSMCYASPVWCAWWGLHVWSFLFQSSTSLLLG